MEPCLPCARVRVETPRQDCGATELVNAPEAIAWKNDLYAVVLTRSLACFVESDCQKNRALFRAPATCCEDPLGRNPVACKKFVLSNVHTFPHSRREGGNLLFTSMLSQLVQGTRCHLRTYVLGALGRTSLTATQCLVSSRTDMP